MYIQPNSTLNLLHNVPIDSTYRNTLYFSNANIQASYMASKTKYSKVRYSFIRKERGYIWVDEKCDNLYDINYIMFQNTAYGDKWFYAFVKSVEFYNNETTLLQFEIDVLQTWLFDFTLLESFVEREHSATDVIGDNILPENVNLGEYVYNDYQSLLNMSITPAYGVIVAVADIETTVSANTYDNVVNGCEYYYYSQSSSLQAFLSAYIQKPDAIKGIWVFPSRFLPNGQGQGKIANNSTGVTLNESLGSVGTTIDGYTPKNKKLFTYPYNFINVSNDNGESLSLRYEFFNSQNPQMVIHGCLSNPVEIIGFPMNYKGSENNNFGITYNINESISLNNFPLASWSYDNFQNWLGTGGISSLLSTLNGVTQGAVSGAVHGGGYGALAGAGLGLLSGVTSTLTEGYLESIKGDVCKGNYSNGSVGVGHRFKDMYYGRMSITADYAKCIDDYFTMFGYACRKCKVPNIDTRPAYNYTKTLGCNVVGNVPSDDLRKIADCFDNGVTFWKAWDRVGDYSTPNQV